MQITAPPTIRVPTKSAHFHSSADLGSTPPASLRLSLPSATLRSLPPARLRCPLSPPPPSPPLTPCPRGEVAPSLEPALTLLIPAFSHMAPRASSVLQYSRSLGALEARAGLSSGRLQQKSSRLSRAGLERSVRSKAGLTRQVSGMHCVVEILVPGSCFFFGWADRMYAVGWCGR